MPRTTLHDDDEGTPYTGVKKKSWCSLSRAYAHTFHGSLAMRVASFVVGVAVIAIVVAATSVRAAELSLGSPEADELRDPSLLLPHSSKASLRATPLHLNRELFRETMRAPGTRLYVVSTDSAGMFAEVEVRVSHPALPPVEFAFAVSPFPSDGSVIVDKRKRSARARASGRVNLLRRALQLSNQTKESSDATAVASPRRILDTSILILRPGPSRGFVVDAGTEHKRILIEVRASPVGVVPGGREVSVDVVFNIIAERKYFDNTIPQSGLRMVSFGVASLFVVTLCMVPALTRLLSYADDLVAELYAFDDRRRRR